MTHIGRRRRESPSNVLLREQERPRRDGISNTHRPPTPADGIKSRARSEAQAIGVIVANMRARGLVFCDGRTIDEWEAERREAEFLGQHMRDDWEDIDSGDDDGIRRQVADPVACAKWRERKLRVRGGLGPLSPRAIDVHGWMLERGGWFTAMDVAEDCPFAQRDGVEIRRMVGQLSKHGMIEKVEIKNPGRGPRYRMRAVAKEAKAS